MTEKINKISPAKENLNNDKEESQLPHERKRRCTDIICLIIFILFCLVEAIIFIIGFSQGNIQRLIFPRDSHSRLCGYDYPVHEKPNLIYFDLMECAQLKPSVIWEGCSTKQICVKECPNYFWAYQLAAALENSNGIIFLIFSDMR